MTEWYCTFHYPHNWIEVLHQQVDGGSTIQEQALLSDRVHQAIDRSFSNEPPDQRERLANIVTPLMREDAERDAAISAHGYDEDEQGFPVHMHLTMWVAERSHPTSEEEELALLADAAREAGVNVQVPQVADVMLPAGRALRVQQLDNGFEPDGTQNVIETVDYWVPVQDSDDLLWIHFWTPNLAFSADVVSLFDQMAQALVLEAA